MRSTVVPVAGFSPSSLSTHPWLSHSSAARVAQIAENRAQKRRVRRQLCDETAPTVRQHMIAGTRRRPIAARRPDPNDRTATSIQSLRCELSTPPSAFHRFDVDSSREPARAPNDTAGVGL